MSTIEEKIAKQIQYQRDLGESDDRTAHSYIDVDQLTELIHGWTRGDVKHVRKHVTNELRRLREVGELRYWNHRTPDDGRYLINTILNPDYAAVIVPLLPADGSRIWPVTLLDAAENAGLSDAAARRTIGAMVQQGLIDYDLSGYALPAEGQAPSEWCHAPNPETESAWHCIIPASEHGHFHRDIRGFSWAADGDPRG